MNQLFNKTTKNYRKKLSNNMKCSDGRNVVWTIKENQVSCRKGRKETQKLKNEEWKQSGIKRAMTFKYCNEPHIYFTDILRIV